MECDVDGGVSDGRQAVHRIVQRVRNKHKRTVQRLRTAVTPVGGSEEVRNVGERSNPNVVPNQPDVVEHELIPEGVQVNDDCGRYDEQAPSAARPPTVSLCRSMGTRGTTARGPLSALLPPLAISRRILQVLRGSVTRFYAVLRVLRVLRGSTGSTRYYGFGGGPFSASATSASVSR